MSARPTQARKSKRRVGVGRIWTRGTRKESRALKAVADHEGLKQGEVLRRYSLNDVVAKYDRLKAVP